MPFDGITVSSIVYELNQNIVNGRIDKVYQPEPDVVIVMIRCSGKNLKLLLTANPSYPRINLTKEQTENPTEPPVFCMSLRKRLVGGKVISVEQPNFERIVEIKIQSLNELGDMSVKTLIIEIMGKHSNIILVQDDGVIIDCMKKINHAKSSVREILPGKKYLYPPNQGKYDPLKISYDDFQNIIFEKKSITLCDALYKRFTGISPITASEICSRSSINTSTYIEELPLSDIENAFRHFSNIIDIVKKSNYSPEIIYDNNNIIFEFSSFDYMQFNQFKKKRFDSISYLVEFYYIEKDNYYRVNQKNNDIRRIINTNIERCFKKSDIQKNTLKETENMEELKICGELLTAYISNIKQGDVTYCAENYYNNEIKEIKLDPTKSPSENAQYYYNKYNKAKRTKTALEEQIIQNDLEIKYLEEVSNSLNSSVTTADIDEIREELFEGGYIKKRVGKGKKNIKKKKTEPLHFISSDGYDIFVGKNNKQNDELTLKIASNSDIWMHVKNMPGSHVIIKSNNTTPPETTLSEAANYAVLYSKGRNGVNVPVDYTIRKNVKKPSGAKPGMVVYDNYKTAYITPEKDGLY